MNYAIKAYGKIRTFKSKKSFKDFLFSWITSTEGSERDRAVRALANLDAGIKFTDTDSVDVGGFDLDEKIFN